MIEYSSENRYNISCDQCGHEISDELIKKNQNQNKPLYCELCGAQINLKSSEEEEISKSKRKGEIMTQHEEKKVRFSYTTKELRQEIINYVYQKTYELLKTTPFVIKRLKQQKDLKHSQKIKLAKKLRRILLYTSLPTHGLEQLTKISQKKIKNYFDNFKSGLKTKQKFQPKIHPRIIENIEFCFRLINGDFELSTLSINNQKAVKNLLHTHGFKINIKTKNSFSYQLSLFIGRQIYKKISTQGYVSKLLPNKNQLTKHYISSIAKDMISLILNNVLKRRFFGYYRTLKKDLELDWVYRESLIIHICSLVKLVYKLTYNIGFKSKLNGFERLIAEDLKRSKFFEDVECFSPYFRLNLTLILSRIIYYTIETYQNLTPLQSDYRELNYNDNKKIVSIILNEIIREEKIKNEFLKKFYNLSLEEFVKEYHNLQIKLKSNMLYKENFKTYLRTLINLVYKITHTKAKKSKHSKIELAIIKDLANINLNWETLKKEKFCFYSEKEEASELKKNDIFTIKISENNPLWRVRAYVIGFLLADGSMKTKRSYVISVSQHNQDIDILKNVKKAIGGKISGPYDNIYYLNTYGKKLVSKIKDLGMVECHTKKNIAKNVLPPNFILMKIGDKTIVKDFVRGYFEGDGTFSGTYEDRTVRFGLVGPDKFLKMLQNLILGEISDITTFITKETIRYFIIDKKRYVLYSNLRIYKKSEGFYKLKPKDLEKGVIIKAKHPWLKRLHISGSLNCIKFFNWLYDDNDNFYNFKIEGIRICSKRKFIKCLSTLGNKNSRKERLAPNWSDVISNTIINLDKKYYRSDELLKLVNKDLAEKLHNLGLSYLYGENKIQNLDVFRNRLKYLEYQDEILGRFQKRIGRSNINFYYNKLNQPDNLPIKFERKIDVIDKKGNLKKNLKNLIIYIFLINDNNPLTFKELRKHLIDSHVFFKSTLRPNKINLDLLELASFEIIIIDDSEGNIPDNLYLTNNSIVPTFYKISSKKLKELLTDLFNSDMTKKIK